MTSFIFELQFTALVLTGPYKILFLEDNADDVELMLHELHEAKLDFLSEHAENKNQFLHFVEEFRPDVILADYSLASFNGIQALKLFREKGGDTPFILVTGAISEQMALDFLKEGVDDFILKSSFKRLPSAIINTISKKSTELEKKQIEKQLKKSHAELKSLLNKQHAAREEERLHIARDLHDELGQILTTLKIDVTMLQKKVASVVPPEIGEEFNEIKQTIDNITKSVKRISSGLRPDTMDELGLIESIKILCEEFERRTSISCVADLPKELDIDRDFSIVLYRIIQEGLTNVVRHAKASRVTIKMRLDKEQIALEIRDNGVGIPDEVATSSKSLGLIGLRERAHLLNGKFKIKGQKNKGTVISVSAPLNHQPIPI